MAYKLPHPEAKPPKLNPNRVPPAFRHLIPLAEKYGVSDDSYRIELIYSLDREELRECASFLSSYGDVLDQWLAGPESYGPSYSDEYIVFSALGMAADHADVLLRRIDPPGPQSIDEA